MIKKIRSEKEFGEVSNSTNSIQKIVVSRGNPEAQIVIVGEAPGAKEEEIGEPFVGRSGKLGVKVNDRVSFTPESEYEFYIDDEKLYRMFTNNITIKL